MLGVRNARRSLGQALHQSARACAIAPVWMATAAAAPPSSAQNFFYVEPGTAACPKAPTPTSAAPKAVQPGVALSGRLHVGCGFEQGSYTVTLSSTDTAATFTPKTFLVNFGQIVGAGVFAVRFSTLGLQSVSTSITANMGSPMVLGRFESDGGRFNVVAP